MSSYGSSLDGHIIPRLNINDTWRGIVESRFAELSRNGAITGQSREEFMLHQVLHSDLCISSDGTLPLNINGMDRQVLSGWHVVQVILI